MNHVFIGRKPILDKHLNVLGYQLKFYAGSADGSISALQTTESMLNEFDQTTGFQQLVGEDLAFLSLPREMLIDLRLPKVESKSQLVIEVSANIVSDLDALKALKKIKIAGASIALTNFEYNQACLKLLSIVDYVKLSADVTDMTLLAKWVKFLHSQNTKVIAGQVACYEEFEQFDAIGCDYFQGYFFTRPQYLSEQTLSSSELALLRLLAQINDPQTEVATLAEIVGRDAALSQKLLMIINQPKMGVPIKVENLKQAIQYLGLSRLKFWITTLIMRSGAHVSSELLLTSLMRARFCELFAVSHGEDQLKESYFLAGLFSNLDAYFLLPLKQVIENMPLSEPIVQALLSGEGEIGVSLQVLRQLVEGEVPDLPEEKSLQSVNLMFLEASAWAKDSLSDLQK